MTDICREMGVHNGKVSSMTRIIKRETRKQENKDLKMIKIFLLEDDLGLINGLSFAFKKQGFEPYIARTLEEADELWEDGKYDLLVLDVSLPDGSGFEFCKKVRQVSKVPIIFLTAADEEMDIIMGLDIGGDDYITKPFNILEVKARIKAIMRRTSPERAPQVQSSVIEKGDIKLDCDSRRLFINDNEINLTAREFELLEILIKNENKVYSRESLLKIVWGEDYPGDVRTVDVHVRRLREKIEANPSEPKYVHTKWGVGYYYQS